MIPLSLRLQPKVEWAWLKKINFYPPRLPSSQALDALSKICIGTKTRTIGDALVLSTLPRKLKTRFPALRITTYPRAFNPIVFHANPHVDGVSYLPDALFGDDSNWGFGHLIDLKEQFFELENEASSHPRPEIYLTDAEKQWAKEKLLALNPKSLPLCIVHPWGHTWKNVAALDFWQQALTPLRNQFFFLQVGILGHEKVPGCEETFFTPRAAFHARKLFALISQAQAFIGVNSGPMHVAAAFSVPSLILTEQGNVERIFETRRKHPWFLHFNWANGFLYPQNQHLDLPNRPVKDAIQSTAAFLEPLSRLNP